GAGVRLAEILRRLQEKEGLNIVCVSTAYNRKFFENNGIRADFKNIDSNFKFESFAGLYLKSLLTILKSFFLLKKDFLEKTGANTVLYSSSDLFWEVIPAYYLKTRGKNNEWIQVIHHIYPNWKKRPGKKIINWLGYHFQRFSFRLARKKADKIIVLNSIVKKDLVRMGFSKGKISTSSNGIDVDYFDRIKKETAGYDGIFLGRLSPSKGIADLVEIWENVCRKIPEAKLAIIGGGKKEKKSLMEKIEEKNLSRNVDVLGYLEDSEAHRILKSGKVFLFPSHEEGWGIAATEAMACGLPVVSWNLPVFGEIFGNRTMQIEKGNVGAFSGKIIELLGDDALRLSAGENGRDFVKKYSWDSVAEGELEIINSC
ncbi:MAG: glycosyltransferase family 4 protein, partial [Candidatus Moranbacteria bacterium]|nr:glycosyltransferase family 4 protein [Candidatus Moranbacteria bacterium]